MIEVKNVSFMYERGNKEVLSNINFKIDNNESVGIIGARRRFIYVLNSLKSTKIVTSHDLDLIYDSCERTILISEGKIVKDGLTKEILSDKELLEKNNLELPLSLTRRDI